MADDIDDLEARLETLRAERDAVACERDEAWDAYRDADGHWNRKGYTQGFLGEFANSDAEETYHASVDNLHRYERLGDQLRILDRDIDDVESDLRDLERARERAEDPAPSRPGRPASLDDDDEFDGGVRRPLPVARPLDLEAIRQKAYDDEMARLAALDPEALDAELDRLDGLDGLDGLGSPDAELEGPGDSGAGAMTVPATIDLTEGRANAPRSRAERLQKAAERWGPDTEVVDGPRGPVVALAGTGLFAPVLADALSVDDTTAGLLEAWAARHRFEADDPWSVHRAAQTLLEGRDAPGVAVPGTLRVRFPADAAPLELTDAQLDELDRQLARYRERGVVHSPEAMYRLAGFKAAAPTRGRRRRFGRR